MDDTLFLSELPSSLYADCDDEESQRLFDAFINFGDDSGLELEEVPGAHLPVSPSKAVQPTCPSPPPTEPAPMIVDTSVSSAGSSTRQQSPPTPPTALPQVPVTYNIIEVWPGVYAQVLQAYPMMPVTMSPPAQGPFGVPSFAPWPMHSYISHPSQSSIPEYPNQMMPHQNLFHFGMNTTALPQTASQRAPASNKRAFEFVEPTVPEKFVANPNNHGRWEIDSVGNRKYLNAPKVKRPRVSGN